MDVWDTIVKYLYGNLSPFNNPSALRSLTPATPDGASVYPSPVDLAALGLHGDRKRGILHYNDFRRLHNLPRFKSCNDVTGGDKKAVDDLSAVC